MNLLLTQSFAALRSIDHQKRVGCPAGLLHEPPFPRGCRQKSLLQTITARSWQMAKYDAVLLA